MRGVAVQLAHLTRQEEEEGWQVVQRKRRGLSHIRSSQKKEEVGERPCVRVQQSHPKATTRWNDKPSKERQTLSEERQESSKKRSWVIKNTKESQMPEEIQMQQEGTKKSSPVRQRQQEPTTKRAAESSTPRSSDTLTKKKEVTPQEKKGIQIQISRSQSLLSGTPATTQTKSDGHWICSPEQAVCAGHWKPLAITS